MKLGRWELDELNNPQEARIAMIPRVARMGREG